MTHMVGALTMAHSTMRQRTQLVLDFLIEPAFWELATTFLGLIWSHPSARQPGQVTTSWRCIQPMPAAVSNFALGSFPQSDPFKKLV